MRGFGVDCCTWISIWDPENGFLGIALVEFDGMRSLGH